MTNEELNQRTIYNRMQTLRKKTINSDFTFYPKLTLSMKHPFLLISGATLPALDESDACSVNVTETVAGDGRAIVQAMRDAGTFEAILYEGFEDQFTCKRILECTFLAVDPLARDWAERQKLNTYTVRLRMVEKSIEYSEARALAAA